MNNTLVKVLNRLNWLKHTNVFSATRVLGKNVSIPLLSGVGLENLPFYEIWMCDLIKYALSVKKGFFMDIGANVGQTLIKLRVVDEERPYLGFEPNPECVHYFNELVKINRYKNVELIPAGLFDQNSILSLKLYSDSSTDQGASLIENFREAKVIQKINVPVFEYTHIEEKLELGTAVLTGDEVERLLTIIFSLKAQGIAVLYISHRLDEVQRVADRLTVLRDGRMVSTHPGHTLSQMDMAHLMVGRELASLYPPRALRSMTEPMPLCEAPACRGGSRTCPSRYTRAKSSASPA